MNKRIPSFRREKQMKFLEESAWNSMNIKEDKNFQPEDMEASDLLNDNLKVIKAVKNTFSPQGTSGKELMKKVKKHPIIYDVNHPDYDNKTLTDKAWSEIASELKITGKFYS